LEKGSFPIHGLEALEVLCKNQAYVIKRQVPGTPKPTGAQVTWSRHGGPVNAWKEALERAGVVSNE